MWCGVVGYVLYEPCAMCPKISVPVLTVIESLHVVTYQMNSNHIRLYTRINICANNQRKSNNFRDYMYVAFKPATLLILSQFFRYAIFFSP